MVAFGGRAVLSVFSDHAAFARPLGKRPIESDSDCGRNCFFFHQSMVNPLQSPYRFLFSNSASLGVAFGGTSGNEGRTPTQNPTFTRDRGARRVGTYCMCGFSLY